MLEKVISENIDKVLADYSNLLGNRKDYVGASDIGQCERKVVLSKVENVDTSAEQKTVMLRGHLSENVVGDILEKAGLYFKRQYEVIHPQYSFIRAHIDFLFQAKNGTKGVLEVKTTTGIPDEPYMSWVLQLQMQMNLVKLRFPQDEVKGAILVLDLSSGEIKEFNGFTPNSNIFAVLVEKAKRIYEKVRNNDKQNLKTEVSFLCGSCPFKATCPEWSGDEQKVSDDIRRLVEYYKSLAEDEKELKKEKEAVKQDLIKVIGEGELKFNGNKVTVKNTVRKSLDSKALQKELPEIYERFLTEREMVYFRVD
ncbi:hypothetical protein [Hippea maritima]|uniref:DUF83 domain-containing protein n=1 Tax=Hippea maritima (strain ATCC 700847 / DSM 10411 / MH2) TaxID=760142 RepID=F2LV40_HIPMA|nr:hypothetical protein [Hippea maritima]AEA33624.1 hypothetical protein Hipma_0654 [Hippea maritima DSM 10411]